jgi:hypothetical protein
MPRRLTPIQCLLGNRYSGPFLVKLFDATRRFPPPDVFLFRHEFVQLYPSDREDCLQRLPPTTRQRGQPTTLVSLLGSSIQRTILHQIPRSRGDPRPRGCRTMHRRRVVPGQYVWSEVPTFRLRWGRCLFSISWIRCRNRDGMG